MLAASDGFFAEKENLIRLPTAFSWRTRTTGLRRGRYQS